MEDREVIEVGGDGEPVRFSFPDAGETEGVFRCVALGILDKRQKIGRLVHALPLTGRSLENLVDEALAEARNPNDLLIGVAGNIPPSRFERKEMNDEDFEKEQLLMKDHARWIIEMLLAKGIKKGKIINQLSAKPATGDYRMLVDTAEPAILIEFEELELED